MTVERGFRNKEWGNQLTNIFRSEEKKWRFAVILKSYEALLTQINPCQRS